MRVHIIQHLAHEHAASIIAWANKNNHVLSYTCLFHEQFAFPSMEEFDMLVILGGTMGAYEEEKFSWLSIEKGFIRQAIDAKKLVLGICLGSQILAEALGSKAYPHHKKEVGFFPIYKTADAMQDASLKCIPESWMVFHWHGDTFDLPEGATHLFFSDACKNQGFKKGRCYGFQFHGEINNDLLHAMISHERSELEKDTYVQCEAEILGYTIIDENIKYFDSFLDEVTQREAVK